MLYLLLCYFIVFSNFQMHLQHCIGPVFLLRGMVVQCFVKLLHSLLFFYRTQKAFSVRYFYLKDKSQSKLLLSRQGVVIIK